MSEISLEKTPIVTLRLLEPSKDDALAYFAFLTEEGNPEHFSNFNNMPKDYQLHLTVEQILKNWTETPKAHFGVYVGRHLVGTINLRPITSVMFESNGELRPLAEIDYLVSKEYSGRGIAVAALKELIQLEKERYSDFVALVHPQNTASNEALLRAGFIKKTEQYEGNNVFEWNVQHKELLSLPKPGI